MMRVSVLGVNFVPPSEPSETAGNRRGSNDASPKCVDLIPVEGTYDEASFDQVRYRRKMRNLCGVGVSPARTTLRAGETPTPRHHFAILRATSASFWCASSHA